jgi:predicted membrane channel-forming protein YqfA (hemolysin III family)
LRSAFEWHNEVRNFVIILLEAKLTSSRQTINIQSHFVGFLSLVYLLVWLLPGSPHWLPHSHRADTAIAFLFIGAAMKCLLCSAAWHLLSGCATGHWHRGAACVDYVGISGLIAASVMGVEYYGFYCRPNLSAAYMTFSAVLGVSGMVLPWVRSSPALLFAESLTNSLAATRNPGSTSVVTRCGASGSSSSSPAAQRPLSLTCPFFTA